MRTQEARDAFRSHIRGFARSGADRGKPYGDASGLIGVEHPCTPALRPSGRLTLLWHPEAADYGRAIAAICLHHGYLITESSSGTLSWRNITGARLDAIEAQIACQCPRATSLHAHGLAVDLNPSANPYGTRRTDFPPAMVAALAAVRCRDGARALKHGLTWSSTPDPMHIEATYPSVESIRSGLDPLSVIGWARYLEWAGDDEGEMALRRGARGDLVRYYQAALRQRQIELGVPALALLEVDGDYGPDTEAAVREYQLAADVEQTGIIDGAVAAAIARYHPEIRLHAHTGTAVPQHPHTATITLT